MTAPARSIVDAAVAGTAPEQIESAVRQALDEGLVTSRSLLTQLGRHDSGRVGHLIRRSIAGSGAS